MFTGRDFAGEEVVPYREEAGEWPRLGAEMGTAPLPLGAPCPQLCHQLRQLPATLLPLSFLSLL